MSTTAPLKTPLYDWHVSAGGRMVDFAGWSMPVQYSSIVEEHRAVRQSLGLFDISHMGRLEVAGPDSAAFLDHVCTRRVIGMKPSQIRYSLVCYKNGGILDDVLVYQLDEKLESETRASHQVVVNASNREKIIAWFGKHKRRFDVSIRDVTTKTAMIAVQGPRAIDVVEPLLNIELAPMRFYTSQTANVAGHACFVSRTGYTGEDGCELTIGSDDAAAVWDVILGAGQAAGAKPAGLGARDTLRLEAAMPLYGHELSEEINPVQAELGFAYQLKDRDFIGREAIRRFENDETLPVRVGIKMDGKRIAREGATVLLGGERVGQVTSGTFSPTLEQPIAMAYVARKAAKPGTQLTIDIRGKEHAAKVVALPFYSRSK